MVLKMSDAWFAPEMYTVQFSAPEAHHLTVRAGTQAVTVELSDGYPRRTITIPSHRKRSEGGADPRRLLRAVTAMNSFLRPEKPPRRFTFMATDDGRLWTTTTSA